MTIKFHSQAREEFFKAADYYEEQVVGLGDTFIDEVENVLDVIEQYPSSGTKVFSFLLPPMELYTQLTMILSKYLPS